MDSNNGIYRINPDISPQSLNEEGEKLLMSTVVVFDILLQKYGHTLPFTQHHYLYAMNNVISQIFLFYAGIYPLQSLDAQQYGGRFNLLLLNPALDKMQRQSSLRALLYQLSSLCEEGLNSVLLDHLTDTGGNLLMNIALQVHSLRQIVEQLERYSSVVTSA